MQLLLLLTCCSVTGLDLSTESLHSAKEHAKKVWYSFTAFPKDLRIKQLGLKTQFKSGSVYDIPATDDSFDVIVITELTEKLLDLPLAFKEISRVLKPGN